MENTTRKQINLVFVCSGAADVGELTDRAARQIRENGLGTMSCLASIGARDSDITFNAEIADCVLLVDGCPNACSRRTFENAGLTRFKQFDLSELGLKKGKSPVSEENIQRVVNHAAEIFTGSTAADAKRQSA